MNHSSNAYLQKKKKNCYQKYTKGFVAHIKGQEPWQGKHSARIILAFSPK
jgi:hypothetical protein